jgi:hypothetical protein
VRDPCDALFALTGGGRSASEPTAAAGLGARCETAFWLVVLEAIADQRQLLPREQHCIDMLKLTSRGIHGDNPVARGGLTVAGLALAAWRLKSQYKRRPS